MVLLVVAAMHGCPLCRRHGVRHNPDVVWRWSAPCPHPRAGRGAAIASPIYFFSGRCHGPYQGDLPQCLCTAAKLKFKFHFESILDTSGKKNYARPNKNCNLTSWVNGCEPDWGCTLQQPWWWCCRHGLQKRHALHDDDAGQRFRDSRVVHGALLADHLLSSTPLVSFIAWTGTKTRWRAMTCLPSLTWVLPCL